MRSINRIHGVILASLGVLLGVMLALSPGEALAEALGADDVLTVGTIGSFAIDEVTINERFIFALPAGELPTPNFTLQLVEPGPLPGLPLNVSDTLEASSVFVPSVDDPQKGFFNQIFTFVSDPNGVGLPNLCAVSGTTCVPERAGPIFVGSFGSLGDVFVKSDAVPEPSTWLLLLLGLGVAGLAAWQQKRGSDLQ